MRCSDPSLNPAQSLHLSHLSQQDGRGALSPSLPIFIFVSQLMTILLRQLGQLRQTLYFRAFSRAWAASAGGTAETDVTPGRPLLARYRPKRLFTSCCQFEAVGTW
jgi:hypothetical protein